MKWSTDENLENVVVGAHLMLKKHIEKNKKKLDKVMIKAVERAISQRERSLQTANVFHKKM